MAQYKLKTKGIHDRVPAAVSFMRGDDTVLEHILSPEVLNDALKRLEILAGPSARKPELRYELETTLFRLYESDVGPTRF
jgi:hypothetical protein